jgi:hypothetical protein
MEKSMSGLEDAVTVYFGINRHTLEVQRVTATPDGMLSRALAGEVPMVRWCGDWSDLETEVILQFGLIEIFSAPKRLQEAEQTRRRVDELIDLSERLRRITAHHPEIRKMEREVDMFAPLPRNETSLFEESMA